MNPLLPVRSPPINHFRPLHLTSIPHVRACRTQKNSSTKMSRVTHLLNLALSLPPSPIRAPGTPQLSDALQKIITRTVPQSSASTSTSAAESSITATPAAVGSVTSAPAVVGPSEEKAMEGMISSLERIQSNASLKEVCHRCIIHGQ